MSNASNNKGRKRSFACTLLAAIHQGQIKTICRWSVISKNWRVHQVQHHWNASKAYGGLELAPKEKVLGGMLCQWECKLEEERDRVILNLPQVSDRTWNAEDFYSGEEFESAKEKIIALSEKLI